MRIDMYLTINGFASSRTKAKEIIEQGRVSVGGAVITKASTEVAESAEITVSESKTTEFVGRGGLKLEAALDAFEISPDQKICVDIGASTGGFTDCLLRRGAKLVFAIDSGRGQLAKELLENDKVVSMEGVNARYITSDDIRGMKADVIVMDVSFISQKLLYPAIKAISADGADIVTLIKPQFEAGKSNLNKNGIVRDDKVRRAVISDIVEHAELFGFDKVGLIESPIKGGSGNTEYLIYLKNNGTMQ